MNPITSVQGENDTSASSAFTLVKRGESLDDVVLVVYRAMVRVHDTCQDRHSAGITNSLVNTHSL